VCFEDAISVGVTFANKPIVARSVKGVEVGGVDVVLVDDAGHKHGDPTGLRISGQSGPRISDRSSVHPSAAARGPKLGWWNGDPACIPVGRDCIAAVQDRDERVVKYEREPASSWR